MPCFVDGTTESMTMSKKETNCLYRPLYFAVFALLQCDEDVKLPKSEINGSGL